ncbi:MAG: hypothetical protein HYU64_00765 [Armatimonadetes bacterium]|nr:hypothetical protein [Armatimonadota bacterium]
MRGSVLDLQGKIGQSISQGQKDAQKELDAYAQSLAKLRDQEFAAKKEQIESQLTRVLDEERKKLDTDMQREVQEALRANQQEKVNLQLKRMAATDKEKIAEIEKQLEVLYKEEQARKDEKAKELSSAFEVIKKKEVARSEQEMRAFQEELSKRYGARLEAKKAELMQRLRQKGPGSAELPSMKKEFADRKQALIGRFESDFRKRQEMLAGEIQAEWARRQKKIREDFEKERETILKELYEKKGKMEGELRQTRDKTVEDLKKEGLKKGDKGGTGEETARDELEGLRHQREQLFLNILAEIKEKVARIAGEKKVRVVLGSYYSKGDCLDLTDWALEAIKK